MEQACGAVVGPHAQAVFYAEAPLYSGVATEDRSLLGNGPSGISVLCNSHVQTDFPKCVLPARRGSLRSWTVVLKQRLGCIFLAFQTLASLPSARSVISLPCPVGRPETAQECGDNFLG